MARFCLCPCANTSLVQSAVPVQPFTAMGSQQSVWQTVVWFREEEGTGEEESGREERGSSGDVLMQEWAFSLFPSSPSGAFQAKYQQVAPAPVVPGQQPQPPPSQPPATIASAAATGATGSSLAVLPAAVDMKELQKRQQLLQSDA